MTFRKGQSGNSNGRPKGTPNKSTSSVRNWLVELINNNRERLQSDFEQLQPLERLTMIEKFLPYVMPKVTKADEVENACFTKADYKESVFNGKQLNKWYEEDSK